MSEKKMIEKKVFENLLINIEESIALVTINRPKALNALNIPILLELKEVFDEIETRKDIKIVILTGSGEKSFVAGADVSEMLNLNPQQAREMTNLAHNLFIKMETIPQVTIAAVNGFALGGGCEISMACDIRISAENAKFGLPEVGLGIIPGFGGTQRLPRLVGKGRAKELIFTADIIDANEAYRIGLTNKVVPQEALLDACKEMANKIISKSSYAVSLAKSCINLGMDIDLLSGCKYESALFGISFSSDDKVEGMTAFLEKRKPNLKDF